MGSAELRAQLHAFCPAHERHLQALRPHRADILRAQFSRGRCSVGDHLGRGSCGHSQDQRVIGIENSRAISRQRPHELADLRGNGLMRAIRTPMVAFDDGDDSHRRL